jgi:hypothetical protein
VAEPQAHRAVLEKRMSRADIILPAIVFATVATLLALGNFVFEYSWTAFAFPLGTGLVLCALCIAELVRLVTAGRVAAPVAIPSVPAAAYAPAPISLASLGWTFALALFLYGLGFVAGCALYLLVCLRANGFSWRLSGAVALASVLVTWGLFIKLMSILLPLKPFWLS